MMKSFTKEPAVVAVLYGISGFCWFSTINTLACSDNSKVKSCFNAEYCHSSGEGIRDLDCFRNNRLTEIKCTWKSPVWSTSKTMYRLIQEQCTPNAVVQCKNHTKLSNTFHHLTVFRNSNLTVYVIDESYDSKNCTVAVFTGTPQNLGRCNSTNIYFKRHSRQLHITTSWDKPDVKEYVVQISEINSKQWRKLQAVSKEEASIAANLTSSMSYEVRVQCLTNNNCGQCPLSHVVIVPPELTDNPTIDKFKVTPQEKGKRLVVIQWKTEQHHSADGYSVTVTKQSGEFQQTLNTSQAAIRLLLSGSAYTITIAAFNEAGPSPPLIETIWPSEQIDFLGPLNITFNNNSSFAAIWNGSLSRSYYCFSLEWGLNGEKPSSRSFYLKKGNHAEITLKEPLQPFKKYLFLLHVRPDKDTCNLKQVNNSEATYGRVESYFREGAPVRAPANIESLNATQDSLVIQWSPIAEDDLRGFLLGYLIDYSVNSQRNQSSGTAGSDFGSQRSSLASSASNAAVVNVSHQVSTHMLTNLKEYTVYRLRMSAFTAAGVGVWSQPVYFKTKPHDPVRTKALLGGITTIIIIIIVISLCIPIFSRLFKRVKIVFWPSIPNPANSNAVQKMDGAYGLEILEPAGKDRSAQFKESNASSLHVIEDEGGAQPSSGSPLLTGESEAPSLVRERTPVESMLTCAQGPAAPPFPGDYTTMMLFNQMKVETLPDTAATDRR